MSLFWIDSGIVGACARGAVAAGLVGAAGDWNGPLVAILALASGLSFFDLGRRARVERTAGSALAGEAYGTAMQLAFLALLCACAWDNRAPEWRWRSPGIAGAFGFGLIIGGARLRQSAARALGRHFTVALSLLDDHELIATGPYHWLRHPNYAALLLIALGTATMVRSPLAVAVTLAVWLPLALLRMRAEERVLHAKLGSRFAEYARERWRLVPGIF